MHALRPRLNALSAHVMTMLMVIVAIGSSVSYMQLHKSDPEVALRLKNVKFLRRHTRERCDQAYVSLDLSADFRKMWTWNIHRMYVSVVAEYKTAAHPRNEVVIWDKILNNRQEALVNMTARRNKYSLKGHGYNLRGKDVLLKFKYNIMPYMGPLMYGAIGEHKFTLPNEYVKSQ